ncbi:MAG: hypothetical protein WED09_07295 [Homoserinimonas sp.]
MDDRLGSGGEIVSAGSLQADLAAQAQQQADKTREAWFGPGHELTAYALEDVLAAGRQVI